MMGLRPRAVVRTAAPVSFRAACPACQRDADWQSRHIDVEWPGSEARSITECRCTCGEEAP